jgi:hypothetical protein
MMKTLDLSLEYKFRMNDFKLFRADRGGHRGGGGSRTYKKLLNSKFYPIWWAKLPKCMGKNGNEK